MNLEQLLSAARDMLDDHAEPPLYTDEELTRFFNNAVAEVALRTRMLQDDSGAACRIELEVGVARYAVAPEVLVVRAVHVPNRSQPLIRLTSAQLDQIEPGWSHEERENGTPKYAVFDVAQKTLTLYPAPAAVGTAHLRVWRKPDEAEIMEAPDDEPVIVLPNDEMLKHWVAVECYQKKDGEQHDPVRAREHEGIFEAVFGPRPSVHSLTLWSTQPLTGPRRMQPDF